MKIAAVGSKQSVLGFKALGAEVFSVANQEDLNNIKEQITGKDFGAVLITEEIASQYHDYIESLYGQALPAILVVPSVGGASEMGKEGLKKILERALGSDKININ